MAVLRISSAGGILPAYPSRGLPEGNAQTNNNLLPSVSEFRPLQNDTTVATVGVSNPQTLYRFARNAAGAPNSDMSTGWTVNSAALNYVKGQTNDDATERTYYTYADGSQTPKATDITAAIRTLGVPAPSTAPSVALTATYGFYPETKEAEVKQAKELMLRRILEDGLVAATVGLADALPASGWLLESQLRPTAPEANLHVLRLFAVNPSTDALISTYSSDMTVADAGWVFDPALGGFYITAPGGFVTPAWATGHTKWWAIRLRGFVEALDVSSAALITALQTVKRPGTQGAINLLTAPQATTVTDRVALLVDKDNELVKPFVDVLYARQTEVAQMFNQGGKAVMKRAVQDYYASSTVTTAISNAKTVFAEQMWRYIELIATATP